MSIYQCSHHRHRFFFFFWQTRSGGKCSPLFVAQKHPAGQEVSSAWQHLFSDKMATSRMTTTGSNSLATKSTVVNLFTLEQRRKRRRRPPPVDNIVILAGVSFCNFFRDNSSFGSKLSNLTLWGILMFAWSAIAYMHNCQKKLCQC